MKTVYLVTSQYMPLVQNQHTLDFKFLKKTLTFASKINEELINEVFEKSKHHLIAFDSKEDAIQIMKFGLLFNKLISNFANKKNLYLGAPLVMTALVDDNLSTEAFGVVSGAAMKKFFEPKSIPYFDIEKQSLSLESIVKAIDKKIAETNDNFKFFFINKQDILIQQEILYLTASSSVATSVKLSDSKDTPNQVIYQNVAPLHSRCKIM